MFNIDALGFLLISLIALTIPAAVIVAVVLVARAASRRTMQDGATASAPNTASRLHELEALRAQALIREDEYERKRAQIIDGL